MKHIKLNSETHIFEVLDNGVRYMCGTYTEIVYEANCISLYRDNGRIEFPISQFIIEYEK